MKEERHKVWAIVVIGSVAIWGICFLVTELRTERIKLQTVTVTEKVCYVIPTQRDSITEVVTLKVVKGKEERGILLLTWDGDLIRLNPVDMVSISSYCDDGITGVKVKTTDGGKVYIKRVYKRNKGVYKSLGNTRKQRMEMKPID